MQKNHTSYKGDPVTREENCRICNEKTGRQIGFVDYWDLKTSRLVQCPNCGHIQLDPMLNDEETAKGCFAYYIEEALRTGKKEQLKNCERNFRRGVVFGFKLKKRKISPRSVLELGPGTGYFSAGLKFVFPGLQVTVMDVNRDILKFNKDHHGFETIEQIPDHFMKSCSGKFDLVIARDIIEHVADISKVLGNVNEYLQPDGLFHFITPNGKEDAWGHYLTFILANTASELLINHVNYFDGGGLKNFLAQKGFSPVDYYTYQIKTTLRGKGWKENPGLMNPASIKRSAEFYIRVKVSELPKIALVNREILDKWYIRAGSKRITWLWCLLHHFVLLRIPPERNIGHEIYGLFRKV